ncbi:hypothetical protein EBU99_08870 [bacterium]|nr:hypothetical protein [bacterium]
MSPQKNTSLWFSCFFSCLAAGLLSGCYTLTQGYEQVKMLTRRVPLDEVLKESNEKPERMNKLKLVPEVLAFAQQRIKLTPGSSYQHYISLDRPVLSYIVQAADKRALKLKTWWFPVVGAQPYLGYFDKQKAIDFQKSLVNEGYDTVMGGVQAFSLLGYFPDPIYSSMLDGNETAEFVELLFHETLHRTVYVPDAYTFNENLAEFVARHATVLFLKERSSGLQQVAAYQEKQNKMQAARIAFRKALASARQELERFYAQPDVAKMPMAEFLKKREEKFAELHAAYQSQSGEQVKGTPYANFFQPGYFNNARILSASVYESRQEPFEQLLERTGSDLANFVQAVKKCVASEHASEDQMWTIVANCKG